MSETISRVLAIDVSKDWLDLATAIDSDVERLPHDKHGIQSVVEHAAAMDAQRITVEASGGWQTRLVAALLHAGLPVIVVNPRQVREYARATGEDGPHRCPGPGGVHHGGTATAQKAQG